MTAYNFQARWADKVQSGEKTQTIRRQRADGRHANPGDRIQLYTGQRTKGCRKLGDGVCVAMHAIEIDKPGGKRTVKYDGETLSADDQFALASDDGFETTDKFFAFFSDTYGLPFVGVLIQWRLEPNALANLTPEREARREPLPRKR